MHTLRFWLAGMLLAPAMLLAEDSSPLWCRWPAISPQGDAIAFGYLGDLWLVPVEGGAARPLTRGPHLEAFPIWSPDGEWIIFSSDRHGNDDLFRVPRGGGPARRLTHHSGAERAWAVDSAGEILFSGSRGDAPASRLHPARFFSEVYGLLPGGTALQRLTTPAEQISLRADGAWLYEPVLSMEDEFRKGHRSSAARDIWLKDAEGRHRRLTRDAGEDREPVWAPSGERFFWLSAQGGGTHNVWVRNLDGGGERQLSFHEDEPVRGLSAADDGLLCYSQAGRIWTLREGGAPQPVSIELAADPLARHEQRLIYGDELSEARLSPDGKELAFIVRGEVFVASVEQGTTRRITDTPGQERSLDFAPDGRSLVYAGERGGSWNLYLARLPEGEHHFYSAARVLEEELLVGPGETFQPRFSPDGLEVAFLANRTELRVLTLADRRQRVIVPETVNYSYVDGDQSFDWSPDGRWFALGFLDKGRWSEEIGVVSAAGGEILNVTQSGYEDFVPRWSADGRMLLFISDRRGLRSHGGWGGETDVWAVFPNRAGWERFQLSPERFEELHGEEVDTPPVEERRGLFGRRKAARKAAADSLNRCEPIELEAEGVERRIMRLTPRPSRIHDFVLAPDGETLYTLARFEQRADLWKTELRKGRSERLAELGLDGGSLEIDREGRFLLVLDSGGGLHSVDCESGEVEGIGVHAELRLRQTEEWAAFYEHIWRQVREKFYDPGLHGVDWEGLKARYARYLPHIDHRRDFAELCSELLGELNASHTGCFAWSTDEGRDASARLGLVIDPAAGGPGWLVAEVLPRGPFDRSDSRLRPGMRLLELDGIPLESVSDGPWPLLNRRAGQPMEALLLDPASGQRLRERVEPIDEGRHGHLLRQRWVERNAADVERLSGGRLGYVHVASMDDGSFRELFSEALGRWADREGLVVDSRVNGGGNLTDRLVAFLGGRRTFRMMVRPGPREIGEEPWSRWSRPSIVLMNESNYSDAHLFPHAFRDNGLGSLVGTPVAGTGTAVWWEELPGGGMVFGIPQVGILDESGRLLENQQLEPDLLVENTPESLAAGRDLQLEAAVAELLRQLDAR
jgi:tricorn protease